jgi:hypothetical protein
MTLTSIEIACIKSGNINFTMDTQVTDLLLSAKVFLIST